MKPQGAKKGVTATDFCKDMNLLFILDDPNEFPLDSSPHGGLQ